MQLLNPFVRHCHGNVFLYQTDDNEFSIFYERILVRLWRNLTTLSCRHAGLCGQHWFIGTEFSTCKLSVNFMNKPSIMAACMGDCHSTHAAFYGRGSLERASDHVTSMAAIFCSS